jgi:uncharacterized Fe-S cluster-containing radical SAM superfamily protein
MILILAQHVMGRVTLSRQASFWLEANGVAFGSRINIAKRFGKLPKLPP